MTGAPGSLTLTWAQKSGVVTATAGVTHMRIKLYNYRNNGWTAFDDVSVTGGEVGITKYYYAGATRVALQRSGFATSNGVLYLFGDHLGSTSLVANADGTPFTCSEQRYKPWGEQRYPAPGDCTLPTTFQYTGQRIESGLSIYYYGARWYDPALGRFLSADTIIPIQQGVIGWDRYAGMNNNPVKYIDPDGNSVELPCPWCDREWINYSGTGGVANTALDVAATGFCLFIGCHVDRENDVVLGPAQEEYVNSSISSLFPNPIGMVGGLGDDALRGAANHLDDIGLKPGTLSNVDARKWYLSQEAKIKDLLDSSLSLEEQAKQAFNLRNQFRTQARLLMADRELAEKLMREEPNLAWEQVVQKAMNRGYSGDDIYRYIIDSSQRSRPSINKSLGLGR
jgi:RHS repeat-associated protein